MQARTSVRRFGCLLWMIFQGLQNPPHKPMHFVQGVPVTRIQDFCL
jgi:hypothetical protein